MDERYQDQMNVWQNPSLPKVVNTPFVTWAILITNVVVWSVIFIEGGTNNPEILTDYGAMFGPFISNGEYWRLFTAMFMHAGLTHLALNGFGMYIFGSLVERTFGHVRFLIIYIFSGLIGSVSSYLLNSLSVGVGASGAIFGVLGALASFFLVHRNVSGMTARRNLYGVLILSLVNLAFGLVTPGIDNAAHIGGFAAGVALGFGLSPRFRVVLTSSVSFGVSVVMSNSRFRLWWVSAASVVVILVGIWSGKFTTPDNGYTHIFVAERYFNQQAYYLALAELDKAVGLEGPIAELHLLRGRILASLGNLTEARVELRMAIRFGNDRVRSEAVNLLLVLNSRQF